MLEKELQELKEAQAGTLNGENNHQREDGAMPPPKEQTHRRSAFLRLDPAEINKAERQEPDEANKEPGREEDYTARTLHRTNRTKNEEEQAELDYRSRDYYYRRPRSPYYEKEDQG